jgi:hypothetical protein
MEGLKCWEKKVERALVRLPRANQVANDNGVLPTPNFRGLRKENIKKIMTVCSKLCYVDTNASIK